MSRRLSGGPVGEGGEKWKDSHTAEHARKKKEKTESWAKARASRDFENTDNCVWCCCGALEGDNERSGHISF